MDICSRLYNTHIKNVVTSARYMPAGYYNEVLFVIPPGGYKDLSYGKVDTTYNRGRWVDVFVFEEGETLEEKMTHIDNSVIRDSAKIILSYENGVVTNKGYKGNLIARMRMILKLRDLTKKFKLYGKQKLGEARNEFDRLVTGIVADPVLATS